MPTKVAPKVAPKKGRPNPPKKPKSKREVIEEREIVYPELEVNGRRIPKESLKITVERAKELLGWESEEEYFHRVRESLPETVAEDCKFGNDYLFKDPEGNKVRCWRNSRNRPFSESWSKSLCQDILGGNWKFNGETIILSKYGVDLSGQHRLIGLVLAGMEWAGDNALHYKAKWPEEPFIESLVVTGIEEDQEVINTLDNVRTRTLGDVFFTSDIFENLHKDQRRKASGMLQNAVGLIWRRTQEAHFGADLYKTHSYAIDFLNRHKKLTEFVRYFLDLDDKNSLSKVGLSPGVFSAVCYYQATSDSDPDDYIACDPTSEDSLDWSNSDKAKRFWKEIADDTALFKQLRRGIAYLSDPDSDKDATFNEKVCIIAKAWKLFKDDKPFSMDDILPKYKENVDGARILIDWPTFGGIDFGFPGKDKDIEDASEEGEEGGQDEEMSEEEMEERVSKERVNAQNRAVKEKAKRK